MKVAIMGAGLSGLSCAITLEKNGITPTIFEKRNCVGDRFVNAEGLLSILNRPIKNSLNYLSDNYNINLKPIAEINKIFVHSKDAVGSVDGKLGFINIRGRHEDSFEYQLEKQVKTDIIYNSALEYEELCKKFDYVVLATGDGEYASHLGNFRCDLTCTLKGATITGDFVSSNPHVWFNYDIIPKGYAWVLPYSDREACMVIAYPDYPDNIKLDINTMWDEFYKLAMKDLDQNFRITDRFEVTRYMIGRCNKPRIDNTYFIGNCFGAISPGLGFGQLTSILSGIYAAHDICGIQNYEESAKSLFENYNHSLEFRKSMENMTDEEINFQVKSLDNIFLDELINRICDNSNELQLLKMLTPFMRIWNTIKSNKDKSN